MKHALVALLLAALSGPTAIAEPIVSTTMPATRASLDGHTLRVRIAAGVTSASKPFDTRRVSVVAEGKDGEIVYTGATTVRRRLTYVAIELPAFVMDATTIKVKID